MYIRLNNGIAELYSISQLRSDNPNTSFPEEPTEELLASWDIYPCDVENPEEYDHFLFKKDFDKIENTNGKWVLKYTLTQLPIEIASASMRGKRNDLLQESDWTQISDSPVDKQVWATYRQALRDITDQEGFPYSITWPTKPE